jgi:hypothetical protein
MSKKKAPDGHEELRLQGAVAIALLSAPSPYSWEKTISVKVLAEEVCTYLGLRKSQLERILTAIKKTIASWLPAGWVELDSKKECVTLHKNAEQVMGDIASKFAFI